MGCDGKVMQEERAILHVVKAGAACVGVAILPTPGILLHSGLAKPSCIDM